MQPSQRGHVQTVESCEPLLSPAGHVHDPGIVAYQHVLGHDALARWGLGPILPAVDHLVRQTSGAQDVYASHDHIFLSGLCPA